ncbi:hypothetical protein D3C75_791910 [compost metagenome]
MSRWLKRNYRHFLWIGEVILIYDDLLAHHKGNMKWLLHYEGTAERVSDKQIEIKNGDASLTVLSLFPAEIHVEEEIGLVDHNPDQKVNYFTLTTDGEERSVKYLNAILPHDPYGVMPLPLVSAKEGDEWIGAQIIHAGEHTDVYYNLRADGRVMHRNSIKTIDGWETDAYLLAITRKEGADPSNLSAIERVFIGYGSFLRRDGAVCYSSLSKTTAVFSWEESALRISISGQPTGKAEIMPFKTTTAVILNGGAPQAADFNQMGAIQLRYKTAMKSKRPG